MKIPIKFDSAAKTYAKYNLIQQKVITELIANIAPTYDKVLDLGCGNGGIYDAFKIKPRYFTGVDISSTMLSLHQKNKNTRLIQCSFDDFDIKEDYDLVISSSALQWSKDLDSLMKKISNHTKHIAFGIFTALSMREIHNFLGIESPILNKADILKIVARYFDIVHYNKTYSIDFETTKDLFLYIRNSGIGGYNLLNYQDSKKLLTDFRSTTLSFEVVYVYDKGTRMEIIKENRGN